MAEVVEAGKQNREKNAAVLASAFQALCIVLCAQSFMSGSVFSPEEMITDWITAGDIWLSVFLWLLCFFLSLRFEWVRRWGLSAAIAAVLMTAAANGGGLGLTLALLFLAYLACPEEIKWGRGLRKRAGTRRKEEGGQGEAEAEKGEKSARQAEGLAGDWSRRRLVTATAIGAAVFLAAAGGITVFRYLEFRSPGFDFGIFAQMFEQMRTTGLPLTTCERGRSLSHFAVHFSPALYFLLPVYCIFPHPLTLVCLQVAGLALGVLPLGGLCRALGLSRRTTGWMILAYLAYPALTGGCLYDFHENFMLTPFLLTFLYLVHTKRLRLAALAALCVLMVKEDAAIYLLCASLYLAVRPGAERRERVFAVVLSCFCVLYFFGAVAYVSSHGLGTLATVHYSQYETGEGGFGNIIANILQNPLHVIWVAFRQEKWLYLLQMFAPLLFLPLIGLKKTQVILLAPMLLFNLMTDYSYQYNIDFQYQFGTLVFLFYITVQVLAGMDREQLQGLLACGMTAAGLLLFVIFHGDRTVYLERWLENRENYGKAEEILEQVREEAEEENQTVAASTMLLAHLWTVDELYDTDQLEDPDQVVLDLRYAEAKELSLEYQKQGYKIREELPGFLVWLSDPGQSGG